jgi:ribosomal protein S12 methylthiotransferase
MDDLVTHAEGLVRSGVREIIVVSQDTTNYGTDLYGKPMLGELLRRLCDVDGLRWLRLHYLYPDGFGDELIELVASQQKIVKYLDIPIQHADDGVLAAMNRRGSAASLDALMTRLRQRIDGLVLRTTVMVGFPGETDAAFERLHSFLSKHKMERAGVFVYSREEGTPAAKLSGQVDGETALKRQEALQLLQNGIIDNWNRLQLGKAITVLCEGYDRIAECYYGRSYADSPDVDGKVFFTSGKQIIPGDFVSVVVTGEIDGDLTGSIKE